MAIEFEIRVSKQAPSAADPAPYERTHPRQRGGMRRDGFQTEPLVERQRIVAIALVERFQRGDTLRAVVLVERGQRNCRR